MADAFTPRPDLMPETFHPPRWLVLTAGGLILAAGAMSAVFTLARDFQPRVAPSVVLAPPSASRASVAIQAVPIGSFVVAAPQAPAPVKRAAPKVEEPIEEVAPDEAEVLEARPPAVEPPPADAVVTPAPPI